MRGAVGGLTALALCVLVLSAPAAAQRPRTIWVGDDAELAAAVAELGSSGGTIRLRPGAYGSLAVYVRPDRLLRISGSRGVRVGHALFSGARGVTLEDVAVRPVDGDARVDVRSSSRIRLERLVVSAAGTERSASIVLEDAHFVTISRSDFSHCGDLSPVFVECLLLLLPTSHVTVEWSRFHDCLGCDFVHGRFRSHLILRGNRLERALPCRMGRVRCGHQDLVELFAGRWLLAERNRFGVYRRGGAQLYVTNDMDHALIRNNVFLGTDPRVPGYRARLGLVVGSAASQRVPLYARVVNNTILTGSRRVDGYRGSVRMSSRYGGVPRAQRPLLANNVIGLLETPWPVCSVARSSHNVVVRGTRARGPTGSAPPPSMPTAAPRASPGCSSTGLTRTRPRRVTSRGAAASGRPTWALTSCAGSPDGRSARAPSRAPWLPARGRPGS